MKHNVQDVCLIGALSCDAFATMDTASTISFISWSLTLRCEVKRAANKSLPTMVQSPNNMILIITWKFNFLSISAIHLGPFLVNQHVVKFEADHVDEICAHWTTKSCLIIFVVNSCYDLFCVDHPFHPNTRNLPSINSVYHAFNFMCCIHPIELHGRQ